MIYKDVQIVKEHFERASLEFDFKFISPFYIDESSSLSAFAFLPSFGTKRGAVIQLSEPPDFEYNQQIKDWANENGCFHSVLNIQPLLQEYNRDYFVDLLKDWNLNGNIDS